MSEEPRKRALIIAISEYEDKQLTTLEFCKNDGEKMYELLKSLEYQISENHKLIGYVEFDKMRNAIHDFFDNRKTKADDTLLFYFSGHGIPISDATCLASSETDYYSPRKLGFSSYDLTNLIQESNSLRVVEVLDCCYSGAAKISKGSEEAAAKLGSIAIENNARLLRQGEGKCLLAASQGTEEAFGLREKEHSIFTYYLLEGLKGNEKSVDSEGNVTPDSLGSYIYKEIMNLHPDRRPKQKPYRKTEASGDIILAYYPKFARPLKIEYNTGTIPTTTTPDAKEGVTTPTSSQVELPIQRHDESNKKINSATRATPPVVRRKIEIVEQTPLDHSPTSDGSPIPPIRPTFSDPNCGPDTKSHNAPRIVDLLSSVKKIRSRYQLLMAILVALVICITLVASNSMPHQTSLYMKNYVSSNLSEPHSSVLPPPNYMIGPNETYQPVSVWSANLTGNGKFNVPTGVAVDPAGYVYVADSGNDRIQKFDSNGTFITKWGTSGFGNGKFHNPQGVAVDSATGYVYVADQGNNRIQKFDSNGTFITKWGTSGFGNGKFYYPQGVAVDSAGSVYVADTYNNRIQKFNSDGTFITKWGTKGKAERQFSYPAGVAVDSAGSVYVADTYNNRIQKFNSDGTFITNWTVGQFYRPNGVAVDSTGNIYAANYENNILQEFNSDGTFITKWGSGGSGNGLFEAPSSVAVDPAGYVYVADQGNNRIQKFNSDGTFITKWGSELNGNRQFDSPEGLAIDKKGFVYVADRNNYRIQKISSNGTFITKWGANGNEGQFSYPESVAVDSAGYVYVADSVNDVVQKFDSTGKFITNWGTLGSNQQFNHPSGIAVDHMRNVYVADQGNNRIQRFDSNGHLITKWGAFGSGKGFFNRPADVAVDPAGYVYVADYGNDRIQKFSSDGTFITKWGTSGFGNGKFHNPQGVAVDSGGNVYVADYGNERIQKFSSTGTFITKWGAFGSGKGFFNRPTGVAVDSAGNVYVTDTLNNRIQVFSRVG